MACGEAATFAPGSDGAPPLPWKVSVVRPGGKNLLTAAVPPGAEVTAVEAYRNVVPEALANDAGRVFRAPLPDWILFASSSAFENLVRVVPPEMLGQVRIGSIGPITSKSVERAGLRVAAEATVHSVDGLVSAVVQASVTG